MTDVEQQFVEKLDLPEHIVANTYAKQLIKNQAHDNESLTEGLLSYDDEESNKISKTKRRRPISEDEDDDEEDDDDDEYQDASDILRKKPWFSLGSHQG